MLPLRFVRHGPRDSFESSLGCLSVRCRDRVPVGVSGVLLTGMNLRWHFATVKRNLPEVGRLNEKKLEGRLTVTVATGCGALDYLRPHRLHGPPALCVSRWPFALIGSPGPVDGHA